MNHLKELRCIVCGRLMPARGRFVYCCPECGPSGTLEVLYDYPKLPKEWRGRGLQRYADWLPISSALALPPILVGDTPLTRVDRLAGALGMDELHVKEDQRNPTGSFKDRASAVVVAAARDLGISLITAASTGNAGSSLAGMAASVGIKTVIFVPASAPPAKIMQLVVYGAQVLLVDGSYDEAFELSLEATRLFGWFNRNTGYNPMALEGKKTVSLELFEQLPEADAVFVSVGDGGIISGLGKGYQDLIRTGLMEKMPRLYGVQAEGSCVLSRAYRIGHLTPEPGASTYADSICVGQPHVAQHALQVVKASQGDFLVVSDDEIRQSQLLLAQTTGIFAEPAGAAALAGISQALAQGALLAHERVVVIVTGHGLKDIAGATSACPQKLPHVDPSQKDLGAQLKALCLT